MEPTIYKPSIYKGAGIYKAGAEGGGGGGGGIPPYYPPIPDEIKIFNCLFCTSNIGTYDNNKKIIFDNLSLMQNDNVSFFVDYETKNTSRSDRFEFFKRSDNLISLGWSYSYSDSTMIISRNGASQYLISVPVSYANTRRQFVMTDSVIIDASINDVLIDEPSIFSSTNIGSLSFPGNNEMKANKMFYYNVKLSRYGVILCDLVPAKKNNIPGFYDKLSGNFYNAVDSSVWECQ